MEPKDKKKVNVDNDLLEALNRTLELEYTLIIYYPRISERIKDIETKHLTQSLGTASIGHADTVSRAITKLGGYFGEIGHLFGLKTAGCPGKSATPI